MIKIRLGVIATVSGPAAVAVMLASPGHALANEPPIAAGGGPSEPAIIGGTKASACQFPTAVLVQAGFSCTGTLVHPQVVLYAAHCGNASAVYFLDDQVSGVKQVPIEFCQTNPGYGGGVGPTDAAFCKLAQPVSGIPLTPVTYGCEVDALKAGTEVYVAGFGLTGSGPASAKHYAKTTIAGVIGNHQGYVVGGSGVSSAEGDSGGPAFVRASDGTWRAFGIVSGQSSLYGPIGPGNPSVYAGMAHNLAWIETAAGVDLTPCHDASGSWSPTDACRGFATDPLSGGTWGSWCAQAGASGPSASCGPPLGGDDMGPPHLAIIDPMDGTTFDGNEAVLDISVDAQDAETGVRRVWLRINGEEIEKFDDSPPYTFESASFPRGTYVIEALAEDLGGNVGVSAPVGIGVGEPAPTPGGTGETDGSGDDGTPDDDSGWTDGDDGLGLGGGADEGDSTGCRVSRRPAPPAGVGLVLLGWWATRRRRSDRRVSPSSSESPRGRGLALRRGGSVVNRADRVPE